MRNPASARAARFCALPWPNGWPRSAGRTATETAKNVRSAAARSVPECAASASSPRLELAIPAMSLIAIRRHAAPTETSAVRRCGDMRGRLRRQPVAAYSVHVSGTPFSSCSPRSSKTRPEPATRSRTVRVTSTSPGRRERRHAGADVDGDPGDSSVSPRHLAGVEPATDVETAASQRRRGCATRSGSRERDRRRLRARRPQRYRRARLRNG